MAHPSKRLIITLATAVFALSAASTTMAQGQDASPHRIQWRDWTFYTNQPLPTMARTMTIERYPDVGEGHYFVQFTGPVTKQMKGLAIAAGADLLTYVPNNTYLVRMDAEARARVEALPVVQWVGIYQPAMRVSSRLQGEMERARIRPPERRRLDLARPARRPEIERLELTVLLFPGERLARTKRVIERSGATILDTAEGRRRSKLRISCGPETVPELARLDGVMWIERFVLPELHNDTGRGVMNTDPVWNTGLRGNGQVIALSDSGLDSGVNDATMHADVQGRIANIFSWPVQPGVDNAGADDGAADLDSGHGTHTTGSAAGNGITAGGTFSGVAPDATIVFQAIEQFTDFPALPGWPADGYALSGIPVDLNDLFQQAYDAGARIHSNSWGAPVFGVYTAESEEVDNFVWEHPDMLILYSAGNAGQDADGDSVVDPDSIGSPGTAKNALTVGASENNRPTIPQTYGSGNGPVIDADPIANNTNGLAAFSSRGPTDDGRIKPDVVAPGTMVASMRSQASPNQIWFFDAMESGPNGWTGGGNWAQITADANSPTTCWHDSPGGNYADNVNASLTSPTQNLTGGGLGGKAIAFWCRYTLGTGDQWFLEVSNDGGATWPGGLTFTGTQANWELVSIGLGPFSSVANFRVRFRLQSDNDGNTGDGLYIDDVRIVEGAFGSSLLSDHGIAAPGSLNDLSYMLSNGTSMATPLVAGAAALVRQYYIDEVGVSYVSAALLRATLINGAVEMTPGQYGAGATLEMGPKPNNAEGWGRVDLQNSLFPAAPAVLSHVDELAGLDMGESRDYFLEVTDATVPVTITMVYHDFPGPGIINNLDMTVTTPSGTTMFPNGGTAADASNNVEQIFVSTPGLGTYTINVNGQNVPEGPQPFALVTSAGGTLTDRDPIDVMLVLDLSGSMLSPACPTCDPKLDVLKDSVELFAQLYSALAVPTDRLGVTYFRTNVNEYSLGGDVLLPVLSNLGPMIADVRAQTTTFANLTAMGGGTQSAINRLVDDTRLRNIILFTDGMQNVNPMVVEIDDSPPAGAFHLEIDDVVGRPSSNVPPTTPPTRLDLALNMTVNTIGVGANPAFQTMLANIAQKTGGLTKLTTAPDDELRRFFVEELVDVLRGFSPQIVDYRYGQISDRRVTERFQINEGGHTVLLKLSWDRGEKLVFRPMKDGVDLTRHGRTIQGPFYQIFTIDLPVGGPRGLITSGGTWEMQIRGGRENAGYEAAAIVDDPVLEYDFSVGRGITTVGDPLELKVRVTAGKRPVRDLRQVTATIRKPRQSVGTILSESPTPQPPPDFKPERGATPGQIKLELLQRDPRFAERFRPAKPQKIHLRSNGDGTYSARYDETNVPGAYTVSFQFEGKDRELGTIKRSETRSALVRFGQADLRASELSVRPLKESPFGRDLILHIRPQDRYGNHLGPDNADRIQVKLTEGAVVGETRDLVDGRYLFQLFVPPRLDPQITVTVAGRPVFRGPLSKLTKTYPKRRGE